MILFFHFICLLARYIVSNISRSLSKGKLFWDEENVEAYAESQSFESLREKTGHVKYPVYEGDTLTFFPPVYVQRYETVSLILEDAAQKYSIKKVVDFGCSELGFFMYLKNIEGVREILEVDIDSEVLKRNSFKAAPLTTDYLMGKWKNPLDVYILVGSIADYDDHLIGCDALVGIELIEHLTEDDFDKMPYNVFYKIKPKIAIFTTPNADFNSLFPNFVDFRHKDHRFEWTRKEFYDWSRKILQLYPEYSVKFYGIGTGPEGTENLGCCTQMAVFSRSDDAEFFLTARDEYKAVHNYKLLQHYKYPAYVDNRTTEEKIIHEIEYQAAHLSSLDTWYDYENNESEIPLSSLTEFVSDLCSDDEEIVNILKNNGMTLRQRDNSWFLVYTEAESSPSDNTSRCSDWLNDKISESLCDADDLLVSDKFVWDDDLLCPECSPCFASPRNLKLSESSAAKGDYFSDEVNQGGIAMTRDKIRSAPHSCNHLVQQLDSPNLSTGTESKNEIKNLCPIKSKIPRIKNERYDNSSERKEEKTGLTFLSKPFKKISKSCSLDSLLENINCKPFECESYYLNLIPGGYSSSNVDGTFSPDKRKHLRNCSGSSLLSSSLDRAGDSGYPFSFSPPDDNLTPEQVDELFTENEMMSRSTSSSSEAYVINVINRRPQHDIFIEDLHVENGDLANNNRDGEGNNVEGLMGQILVNEMPAERDPNDNLFFPEGEEFPHWLLNLGELALQPVYLPLHDSDNDEGVGDDSSSRFNPSPDPEDLDFDF